MHRVIRNREEYASRHGYDLLNANSFGLVDKVLSLLLSVTDSQHLPKPSTLTLTHYQPVTCVFALPLTSLDRRHGAS